MPGHYSRNDPLGRLTSFKYTPVFVFLDDKGNKILETRGFRTPREAKALHEFVAGRLYLRTTWQAHLEHYSK